MPKSFDEEALLRELELTHEDAVELIADFRAYLKPALANIEKHLSSKDFKSCRSESHTLKGSAGNLRINAIHETAKSMQNEADNANMDQLQTLFTQLKVQADEFMKETANFH